MEAGVGTRRNKREEMMVFMGGRLRNDVEIFVGGVGLCVGKKRTNIFVVDGIAAMFEMAEGFFESVASRAFIEFESGGIWGSRSVFEQFDEKSGGAAIEENSPNDNDEGGGDDKFSDVTFGKIHSKCKGDGSTKTSVINEDLFFVGEAGIIGGGVDEVDDLRERSNRNSAGKIYPNDGENNKSGVPRNETDGGEADLNVDKSFS